MKKCYPVILGLGMLLSTQAQTLTYNAFASVLSTGEYIKLANSSSFNTSLLQITGTGVTWNASGLTQQAGTPTINMIYANPANTPNGSLFPSSNYAVYDPNLVAYLEYQYFQLTTSNTWENWGVYGPDGAHEIYQNPDKRLQFPFSYGDSFTDTYAKTNYSNATTISSYQTGNRSVSFSGYGTLILPQGSFSNVGLINEVRTNSLGPNSSTYTWWDLNTGMRLLMFSENNGSVTVAFTAANPMDVASSTKPSSVRIFPNPSHGQLSLDLEHGTVNQVSVWNHLGQCIYIDAPQQSGTIQLNLPYTQTGLYLLQITTDEQTLTEKIWLE